MSETNQPVDVRKSIVGYVEASDTASRMDVISAVSSRLDVPSGRVDSELDRLESHGFVYLVNGEVRVP